MKQEYINFITESNRIENIDIPKKDFRKCLQEGTPEIKGQVDALLYAELIKYPLNIEDVKNVHYLLMRNNEKTKYFDAKKDAGKYRKCFVRVGSSVKIPPKEVSAKVKTFCKKFNAKEDPLKTHYYFECVHPFVDGNGRTGRLLLWAQQRLQGLPQNIILFKDRQKYYNKIREYELMLGLENNPDKTAKEIFELLKYTI